MRKTVYNLARYRYHTRFSNNRLRSASLYSIKIPMGETDIVLGCFCLSEGIRLTGAYLSYLRDMGPIVPSPSLIRTLAPMCAANEPTCIQLSMIKGS